MSDISALFYAALRGFLHGLSDRVWAFIRGGGSNAGVFSWLAAHWIEVIVFMVIVGVLADWFIWIVRWRPYLLWFSNLRRRRVGGLISAETFAAAPIYTDDSSAIDGTQFEADDWSDDDEYAEADARFFAEQQDDVTPAQFEELPSESYAELYAEAAYNEALIDDTSREYEGGIAGELAESAKYEELPEDDGENSDAIEPTAVPDDSQDIIEEPYQDEAYQAPPVFSPFSGFEPLTDRWSELFGIEQDDIEQPAYDEEDTGEDTAGKATEEDIVEEDIIEENIVEETEEDTSGTFDDDYNAQSIVEPIEEYADSYSTDETPYEYADYGEHQFGASVGDQYEGDDWEHYEDLSDLYDHEEPPERRGFWQALSDKSSRERNVIRTVTGRPAKRRGLFRITDDEQEAISGLPPMMPLEEGYRRPTMPDKSHGHQYFDDY